MRPILAAIVLAGLLVSLHTIWRYRAGELSSAGFVTDSAEIEFRATSVFSSANQLAGFLLVVVPFALGAIGVFSDRRAQVFCAVTAALAIAGTLLTFSLGALVALVLLPLIYLPIRPAWPAIVVTAAVVIALAPGVWQDCVARIGDTSSSEIASRLDFRDATLNSFADKPVLGVGLEGFGDAYLAQERTGRTFLGGNVFGVPETAHNTYLNPVAELGIVGLAALVLLIAAVARVAISLRRSAAPRARSVRCWRRSDWSCSCTTSSVSPSRIRRARSSAGG
jgi:O-antigen ligase